MKVNCSGWALTRTPGHVDVREKYVDTGHATADECADAMRAPKVALLFHTQAGMPHAPLWQEWLASIAGIKRVTCLSVSWWCDVLPLDSIRDEACRIQPHTDMVTLSRVCLLDPSIPAHRRQHLFSLYLHNSPDHPGFPPGHIFHQTEIPGRVPNFLGHQPRTVAVKRLLEVALWEPLNQRFVVLSEATIPIYPPQAVYRQLLSETFSRINACNLEEIPHATVMQSHDRMEARWQPGLARFGISQDKWRRHSKQLSLTRAHSWLVALDDHIINAFENLCELLTDLPPGTCFSDEHYISTLLAYHSQDPHTDCLGLVANSSWGLSHPAGLPVHPDTAADPLTPQPSSQITVDLLVNMRRPRMHCMSEVAIQSAARTFGTFLDAYAPGRVQFDARALHFECPLFGESFDAATAPQLLKVMTSPDGIDTLQIFPKPAAPAVASHAGMGGMSPAHSGRHPARRHDE
ncbi:hypothetical protein WJX84_009178 [Apatococcus fuscideae]|uniref:Uncharacterized protein n=1 Tax=Apatococcus fuscideae TaxID=2026836 RepID=A0AAW1TCJ1_9CHLO